MNRIISRNIRHLLPLLFLIGTSAQAGDLSIPNTFQGGTKAMASQVNDNFSAVESAVDDNNARITELENLVSTLQTTVTALQNQIGDMQDALDSMQAASATQFITDLQTVMDVDTGTDSVVFSGVNVQINNGMGSTGTVNGLGNLIVGYDEARPVPVPNNKTGSHNVVIGPQHNYSQYAGLVAGIQNSISGVGASVSGGAFNTASGESSSVSGGSVNTASGDYSSVSGGANNIAGGENSSVSGGLENQASGPNSSVSGGSANMASTDGSSVSGGNSRTAGIDNDDWAAGSLYETE